MCVYNLNAGIFREQVCFYWGGGCMFVSFFCQTFGNFCSHLVFMQVSLLKTFLIFKNQSIQINFFLTVTSYLSIYLSAEIYRLYS